MGPDSVHTLITISFSHYNEKARWALQRFAVPFRERAYMPLFHMAPVMLATRFGRHGHGDKVSSKYSTPVLVTDDGLRLCDSTAIVAWVCQHHATQQNTLIPDDEVRELDRELSSSFGAHTRRVGYGLAFDRHAGNAIARSTVGPTQALMWRVLQPAVLRAVYRGLAIEPTRIERSIAQVREVFARMSDRLAGRRYLVGGRFTLADLTLAALAVPVILPTRAEGYCGGLPGVDMLPPRAAELAHELRATPAGLHVLRMYAEHRGEVVTA